MTEYGHVPAASARRTRTNYLVKVTERTHIEKMGADARFTEDDGKTWTEVPGQHDSVDEPLGLHRELPEGG